MGDRPRGRGGRGQSARGGGGQQSVPSSQRGPGPAPRQQAPQGAWGQQGGAPPQQAPQGAWGQQRSGGPPPQGAWGQRPQQAPQPPPAGAGWGPRPGGGGPAPRPVGGPSPRPTGPPAAGRATVRESTTRGVEQQMKSLDIGGSGDATRQAAPGSGAAGDAGKGASRGRRNPVVDILRTRPQSASTTKSGQTGQAVRLETNYFQIVSHPDWRLSTYRVDFAPEEDDTRFKKKMLRVHRDVIGGYIFDGSVLYTSHAIKPEPLELFSDHPISQTPVQIKVRFVADLAYGDYHYIQFFNIIMRQCLGSLNMQLVGRNMFDAAAKININEHRIELWPGYVTSIRQHEHNILMCAEITHKVMRRDTVYDLLRECYAESKQEGQKNFVKRICGATVLTEYNNHTYRIDDVDFNTTPDDTFQMKDGSSISYRDYFFNKHKQRISATNQPMLVSRPKKSEIRSGQVSELVYLVPELCRMTGLTDAQRANFQTMRALAEFTRVSPDGRIRKLLAFNERLQKQKDVLQVLKEWDLKLATNLMSLSGRVLQPETIVQGPQGSIKISAGNEANWQRDLRNNEMLSCAQLRNWVCITPAFVSKGAEQFCDSLIRAARGMKFNMPRPEICVIKDDRVPTYLAELDHVIANRRPELIMCVVGNNKADRYSAIKKKCCVDKAVPTQVLLSKHFNNQKGLMSVATKVAIQINCKLGGAPWGVEIPMKDLMVMGFDVCHDSLKKELSYGALVASLNPTLSRYYSYVSQHSKGEELSNDFAFTVVKAIRAYIKLHGTPPGKIVIYRDGVGDGQIQHVLEHEVAAIKAQLKQFYPQEGSLKMAFIIVSKRINTRFFLNRNNPPPGTVVDDVVTLPERYDFFIVSQFVTQGTVTPTSYNVIEDTLGLDPDKIQRLTYKLCHLYYNWSGTVRVPAPCQYAHKLAFLAGQALHRNPSTQLENLLYFL